MYLKKPAILEMKKKKEEEYKNKKGYKRGHYYLWVNKIDNYVLLLMMANF
jgi:hypothetical protein